MAEVDNVLLKQTAPVGMCCILWNNHFHNNYLYTFNVNFKSIANYLDKAAIWKPNTLRCKV